MLITYFVQNATSSKDKKETNVAVYEIEEDNIRVKDLIGRQFLSLIEKFWLNFLKNDDDRYVSVGTLEKSSFSM